MEKLYSLYDYLGKPAGPELGKCVALAAKVAKEKFSTRKIANPKYVGKIQEYRKEFLDKYFDEEKKKRTI